MQTIFAPALPRMLSHRSPEEFLSLSSSLWAPRSDDSPAKKTFPTHLQRPAMRPMDMRRFGMLAYLIVRGWDDRVLGEVCQAGKGLCHECHDSLYGLSNAAWLQVHCCSRMTYVGTHLACR